MRIPVFIPQLRISVLFLAGALVLGTGFLFWGLSQHSTSKAELARDATRASDAAQAAREAPGKLRSSQEKAGIYEQLRQNGFIGPEQRTGWITALGQARAALKLDSLSWRLSPRSPSLLVPGLHVSTMDVSASSLNAAGLDTLLKELRKTAPGRFTVERCALVLNPDGASGQAECRINWWTWEDAASRR